MNREAYKRLGVLLVAVVSIFAVLIGCGGGGGGAAAGGLNVFITDDLSTGYDQIWVTVFEVEARSASGQHTTVFDSSDGVVVDLTNLNNGSAQFLYLGTSGLSAGDYSGMRVTVGRAVTLVPTGSMTGEVCAFAPAFDHGSDRSRMQLDFGAQEAFSGTGDVVIDFDLSQWTKVGSVVTPTIIDGDTTGLDDSSRHEEDDYHGTVSGLSTGSFRLNGPTGSLLTVVITDATVVFNEDGTGSPTLANGQRVEVTGTFNRTSRSLTATKIKIEDSNSSDNDDDEVEGVTQNFNESALTFDVLAREIEGFLPSDPIVHVQISQGTRFFSASGLPLTLTEMIVLLNAGPLEVEVEGVYNNGTNTLTAAKMKEHPEDNDDHEAEAKGNASNINTVAQTLDMSLREWFGFTGSIGATVSVTTSGITEYEGENGETLLAAQFFAAVQNGSLVDARGVFANGAIAADRVRLKSGNGGNNDNHDEAKGYVASSNETAGTVAITLTEWFGFSGSFGGNVTIQTNGTTAYRDDNGNSISKAAFFAALSAGRVIDGEGTFVSGVLTAKRARLKD